MVIWLEIAWFKLLWIVTLSSSVTYKSTSLSTLFTLHKYKYFFVSMVFLFLFCITLPWTLYLFQDYTVKYFGLDSTIHIYIYIYIYIFIYLNYKKKKKNWSCYTCFFKATHAASIAENFFGMFTGKRRPYIFDTIPFYYIWLNQCLYLLVLVNLVLFCCFTSYVSTLQKL